jgi:hypothetical protein
MLILIPVPIAQNLAGSARGGDPKGVTALLFVILLSLRVLERTLLLKITGRFLWGGSSFLKISVSWMKT